MVARVIPTEARTRAMVEGEVGEVSLSEGASVIFWYSSVSIEEVDAFAIESLSMVAIFSDLLLSSRGM